MNSYLVIPVLNEKDSIGLVLENLPKGLFSKIIISDNGSSDGTLEVLKKFDVDIHNEVKRGYGSACLGAIKFLRNKYRPQENDRLFFIDGDFSDDPKELTLLAKSLDQGFQFCLGSRMSGSMQKGAMPPHARFGNWLATTILSFLYPHFKFSDLGPMRAINWGIYEALDMRDQNFGWTIEMQMKVLQMKYKCSEVPVSYKVRIGVSKISGSVSGSIKAGVKILYSLWKYY